MLSFQYYLLYCYYQNHYSYYYYYFILLVVAILQFLVYLHTYPLQFNIISAKYRISWICHAWLLSFTIYITLLDSLGRFLYITSCSYTSNRINKWNERLIHNVSTFRNLLIICFFCVLLLILIWYLIESESKIYNVQFC